MQVLTTQLELYCGAVAGLLSHWLWYVHGEHDNLAGIYIRMYALLGVLLIILHNRTLDLSLIASVATTFGIAVSYFSTLYLSIICYRLFLAPTRHIPGPTRLKISKIYHSWKNRRFDNYRYLHELNQQYGDVVRTGPNEVTLFTAEAFDKVYGPESQCTRSVYYEAIKPLTSMVNSKDLNVHSVWRKVWDQAFGQKALESYEPLVYFYARKLIKWLDRSDGQPVEVSSCFERYAFDVMGRIGLDLEFNLLDGQPSRVHHIYQAGAKILGRIISIPWFVSATSWIPSLHKNRLEKQAWICSELEKKRDGVLVKNCIMDHLIAEAQSRGGFEKNHNHLQGEWLVVMAAGIDPMMKCLTDMMWYLANDSSHLAKIRSELASIDSINDYRQLMQLPYLNAVIYETFRLNPAIPSAGARQAPPEGFEVNGVVIPGNTIVLVPQHTLFRRPDCFVQPDDFVPERWTTKPELILNKDAFHPWSAGRFHCVGKHLGLMEIRIAAAMVIENFDIEFAKGHDRDEVFEKMADHFVSLPGPLHVVLKRRDYLAACATEKRVMK